MDRSANDWIPVCQVANKTVLALSVFKMPATNIKNELQSKNKMYFLHKATT